MPASTSHRGPLAGPAIAPTTSGVRPPERRVRNARGPARYRSRGARVMRRCNPATGSQRGEEPGSADQRRQQNDRHHLERNDEVGYAYLFPTEGDLKGYQLVYKSPAAIINLPVEYELTDIPLP